MRNEDKERWMTADLEVVALLEALAAEDASARAVLDKGLLTDQSALLNRYQAAVTIAQWLLNVLAATIAQSEERESEEEQIKNEILRSLRRQILDEDGEESD